MDGSASIGLEQALLGHSLGFAPMASPTQVYVALCLASTAPSETVRGLEASGGGYVRTPATFALISGPSNIAANTTSVEFQQATSSWGVVGFFELWDAASGGNRLYWGQLVDPADFTTPLTITVSAGDIVRFSAGTLGVQAATGSGGTASIGAYLPLAGGTLTGPVYLAGDPTDTLQAATKQYVDAHSGSGGGPGFLPLSGGTMLGPLNYTATGGTTSRSAQDIAADRVNVKDFGALLNGTAPDGAAIGAALATLQPHESIYFPGGNAVITWGGIQGTTPAIPVHFLIDGTTSSGNPMVQAFNRPGKGDLFETYYSGTKYLAIESANADAQGPLRVDFKNAASPGTNGYVSTPIVVNTSDYSGAKTSIWGVHVSFDSYSTQFPTGGWPQHVGISSSVKKHGTSWLAGIHVTAEEDSNRPSSANSALLAMELGHHANGDDDTGLPGTPGVRIGIHLSQSEQLPGGTLPAVFGMGYNLDGSPNAITKSGYGATGVQTYQVFDARTATVPPGYTSPVAALRMDPGQIVDFNGASTATLAGWKGNAGNYLQYRSGKLYYVVAGVDKWSVDASGNMRCAGTVTPSVTP